MITLLPLPRLLLLSAIAALMLILLYAMPLILRHTP